MEHSDNGHSPHSSEVPASEVTSTVPVGGSTELTDLAGLVGLKVPSTDVTTTGGSSAGNASDLLDVEDLADTDDDGGKSDKIGKTKTPLWASPIVKGLFVAGLGGCAFLAIALVFGTLQSAGTRDLTPDIVLSEEEEPEEEVDPLAAALEQQQNEIGQLKTQNALGNQQQALALQEQRSVDPSEVLSLRNRQLDLAESLVENEGTQQEAAKPATSTPPAPTPASRPPTVTRSPAPAPVPRPPAVTRSPASVPRPPAVTRAAEVDPQEQWNTLLALGSYGQGSYVAEVPTAPEEAVSEVPSVSATPVPEVATVPRLSTQSSPAEVLELTEILKNEALTYDQEEAALLGHTLKTIQSGTFAAARLVTPIYWAQDLGNEQQSQRTALELTEPLYADDGSIALESGTLLVAEVMVIAGSGLLELQVTDVVTLNNGVQRTMQLPNQNMVIAGSDGNPLIASEIESNHGIRAAEIQLAALGALGNVGELLNRPDSSTTVIGGDTSVSTVENGSVDILAGLLEGAIDAVLPIEQSRVEDRIDDIDDRPRIWFHAADAEVLVFVADEFTFRLD